MTRRHRLLIGLLGAAALILLAVAWLAWQRGGLALLQPGMGICQAKPVIAVAA
jgi:hypothetical protein